jgi:RHS repeat-associated protein
LTHTINPDTKRLDSISGSYTLGYQYDSQGNVIQRGGQSYSFDIGNRMRSAPGVTTHAYDGLGRRVSVVGTDGVNRIYVYGQEGKLLYATTTGQALAAGTKYVYLHKHVVAEVDSGGAVYDHTDGLGSPVAKTNASAGLISRTHYEPYGATAAGAEPTIGFTGHLNAANLGLVDMQQRFYDPVAGRFLSIDPVVTDANTGGSFNRYAYANNSPYKYVDPDGRFSAEACADMVGNCQNFGGRTYNSNDSQMVKQTTAQYHFEMMGEAIEKVGEWYLAGLSLLIPEIGAARAVRFVPVSTAEIIAINRSVGGTTALTGSVETVIANAGNYTTNIEKIAVHDIAGRHLFNDGNKRTAQIVVGKLGAKNGVALEPTKVRTVIDGVARGEIRAVDDIARELGGK